MQNKKADEANGLNGGSKKKREETEGDLYLKFAL